MGGSSEVSSLFVLLLGMGTVFFGLICLIYLTKLMSLAIRKVEKPAVKAAAVVPAQAVVAQGVAFGDRKLLDAIIAAAIATYDGTDMQGMRIHSVRQLGAAASDRGPFVAAVSAAVATAMGTDVEGLRIHSIKKI